MRLRDDTLGRLATLAPNRKFAATAQTGMLSRPSDLRAHGAFIYSYYGRFAALAVARARQRILDRVTVVGEEHLDSGALLISVHLGDFDAAGAWLAARRGITPVVVARPIHPRWRELAFTTVRRRCGAIVRDAKATTIRDLEHDLRLGRTVLVMVDRRVPGPTVATWLLDRPATAPLSIAVLAARTRARLLPAATWRTPDGGIVVWFGEPRIATTIAEATTALNSCATQLGDHIRRRPEQWHVPTDATELAWVHSSASSPPDAMLGARTVARKESA